MLWSRKSPTPPPASTRSVGLDLTASRVRAVSVSPDRIRTISLDEPADELALYFACDRRTPEVGRAGYGQCRTLSHLVYSNFLASLGQPSDRQIGRHTLGADSALEIVFARLRPSVLAEAGTVALGLPAYLNPLQVAKAASVSARAGLTLAGTAVSPLAIVWAGALAFLAAEPAETDSADWVVPLRPQQGGPGSVVVVDVDDFATTATVVDVQRDTVRVVASAVWPRAGLKLWKDRLLDAVSDRCVRLCRRDPRDSAAAEQSLFEQLDDAMARARAGQRSMLNVRTDHWYQDMVFQPDDFATACIGLTKIVSDGLREVLHENATMPPRAVWLTAAAARLPGLADAIHENTADGTVIESLAADAVGKAVASLTAAWSSSDLPRHHLDTVIPLRRASVGKEKRGVGKPR